VLTFRVEQGFSPALRTDLVWALAPEVQRTAVQAITAIN
jgi:hypothetical protein